MKSTERHHLKHNELADLAVGAREIVNERRTQIATIVIAVLVIGGALIGYVSWRSRIDTRAHAMLADALSIEDARIGPPAAFQSQPSAGLSFASERERNQAALTKYKEVADQYPSNDAGIFARYMQATTYMALGVPKSAADAYQQVISAGGDSLYAQMAKLGLAEAQSQMGQYDQSISTFRDLAQRKDGQLPVDGLLMHLGRTYLDAGKTADAAQTFNRLVQEFPESAYAADARKALDALKKPA